MKKTSLFMILVLLFSNIAIATTIENNLYEKESIEIPGYNITLMVIGYKENSVVMCINNNIYLLDKGKSKEIENLKIEPRRVYEDYGKFKITYNCEDCKCNESCSNADCFGGNPINKLSEENQEKIKEEVNEQQEVKSDYKTVRLSIILLLIVLLLLLILLFKKRGK